MKKNLFKHLSEKILNLLEDSKKYKYIVNEDIQIDDLFKLARDKKILNTYKHLFKIAVFISKENKDNIVILLHNEYPNEEKDNISINKKLVDCIGLMEKIFIELNDLNIHRYSDDTKHTILIKILKKTGKESIINNKGDIEDYEADNIENS
jgi:hypothetical protein